MVFPENTSLFLPLNNHILTVEADKYDAVIEGRGWIVILPKRNRPAKPLSASINADISSFFNSLIWHW